MDDWLRPVGVTCTPVDVPRTPDGRADLLALSRAGAPLLLESAPDTPGTGRWSYVVLGTSGRLVHDGTTTTLVVPDGSTRRLGPDPFTAIDDVTAALGATPDDARPDHAPPFVGGLAGALAYDLGRVREPVPTVAAADRDPTCLDLRVVTDLVAHDHHEDRTWRVRRPVAGDPSPAADGLAPTAAPRPPSTPPRRRPVSTSLPPADYRGALDTIGEHVAAGDVFQVNLAQRLSCPWDDDVVALYAALRGASPAPHGALLRRGPTDGIASISPETFLLADGRDVVTRPIKGTRPRHDDPVRDAAARDSLRASAKDRAENVMVVDMERNDLGRVCVPGSVRVTDLLTAEAHPTVWQLVSTVAGRLRPEVGWGGLLAATFPSGSITGTPKVRAMQVVEALEPVRRSWYCGSLGWLGPGSASLSVAIRTAVLYDGVVDYAAGGGIVADSDPDDEIAESWAKAAAFLDAVGAVRPAEAPRTPRRVRTPTDDPTGSGRR